ncbi:unnamed protein product [Discula destructiva]
MLPLTKALLAAALGANCVSAGKGNGTDSAKKLIIGGGPTGLVAAADFDGTSFDIVANHTVAGTSASWLLFKEPNLLYAVDENSDVTRLFNFDPATNELTLVQNATGSSGVVFLELTKDKSQMVGAAFGQGSIDVWDLDSVDGTLTLKKQIDVGGTPGPVVGRQDSPHPHEILLDPTGDFFVVPDLATDSLLVIDSNEFEIQNRITVSPPGVGPRHGSFYPHSKGKEATHYFLACEIASLVKVFELTYTGANLDFKLIQTLSTFGKDFPPANATAASAGELVIDAANKNLYVSNRLTGNATDSISHFSINFDNSSSPLKFVDQISSGGLVPRMFSMSNDDDLLFSTNQDGKSGLLAFAKDKHTGSLKEEPVASVPVSEFAVPGCSSEDDTCGPQFVMEIGSKGSNAK